MKFSLFAYEGCSECGGLGVVDLSLGDCYPPDIASCGTCDRHDFQWKSHTWFSGWPRELLKNTEREMLGEEDACMTYPELSRRRSEAMNNDKVNSVLQNYIMMLRSQGSTSKRLNELSLHDRLSPLMLRKPYDEELERMRLDHVHYMCVEAQTFPPEKLEKKMRWLGFIQGVLWMLGVCSVEQMKRHNMPDAEQPAGIAIPLE